MALFRHALQVYTIACIAISIQGHVLLAVNVEDFRNLANQFLSKNLAAQLSQLVSAGANRRDDTETGNQESEIDLNKVAEFIRDRLLNEYRAPVASTEKVTRKNNIKRFRTVENTVDMDETLKFTNKFINYETTSPGLVYVKDDLETLLQINTDDSNSDRKQINYAGTRLKESEEKTLPQEPTNSKGSFDVMEEEHANKQRDVPTKIDYSETKLGDWLFNHILLQKPNKIQNHKISNTDINDEGNTKETPDESENEKRVQYVYETHISGQNDKIKQNVQNVAALRPKNKHTNDFSIQDQLTGEHGTIDEYVMRPKLKPQKQLTDENYTGSQTRDQENDKKIVMNKHKYVKPIQGNENTLNHGNIALNNDEGRMSASLEEIKPESIKPNNENSLHDAVEGKPQPLEEHITSKGKDIHLKEPQRQPVGENYMYENDELAQQTNRSNNNRVDPQQVYESEQKLIQETDKIFNDENFASNKHEADRSSNHDQLLLRHKKDHPVIKSSKNHQYLSDYKEIKLDKSKIDSLLDDTVEGRDQQKGSHIKFTEEKYTHRKPQNKPIEENDVYEKFALGADTKGNNHGKVKPQPDEDYVFKETVPGMKYGLDHDDFNIDDDAFYNKDKSVLGNTESDSSVKVAKHGGLTTKVPMKEEKIDDDLQPDFQAAQLGSSSSAEIKDKKIENHDTANKYNFEKYDNPSKPKKQPIEENDMYKTYLLGSKDQGSEDREVKNDDDKYGYQENTFGKKNKEEQAVRDKDEQTDMNEKHTLGSAEKNSKREEKRDHNKYKEPDFGKNNKETALGKKDKRDHLDSDKDEENDKYDKYSLSTKDNNIRDREDDEIDHDKYGNKETVPGKKNRGDHRVRNKDEENGMYDKFSQGSRVKNMDGEVENDDDKYGYKETVSGRNNNADHRVRNKDEKNGMYDKYTLGSKVKKSRDREFKKDDKHGYEPTPMGKKNKEDQRQLDKEEENNTYDKYSQGTKDKNIRDRENDEIDHDKYGYKEKVSGKKNHGDHRVRNEDEDNGMYKINSQGSKDKNMDGEDEKDDDKYGYKDTASGRNNNGDHTVRNKDEDNGMYDKYSLGSKDRKSKDRKVENNDGKYRYKKTDSGKKNVENDDEENVKVKKSKDREFKKDDKHGYKPTPIGKKNKEDQRQLDKEKENNMYDKYSPGSKDKNSNTEVKNRDNNNYGYKDTGLGKKNRNRGKEKDPGNNDELLLKNRNRHVMKGTNKGKESKAPSEGYAGDPRPDFKEVKPESIKAKTGSLLDSVEEKGKPTKHFTMKGTLIPKRQFYKMSSPNYYKDLPRIVDKYDFDEPLPEGDRQRDEAKYLKREPSRVNRKLKLPKFEKVKM